MHLKFRVRVLATAMAVLATATLTTTGAAGQPAAVQRAAAHFVVLAPQDENLVKTEISVVSVGGTVIQRWPQIGVIIASSQSPDFAQHLRRMPWVEGVGASRALVEFLPSVPAAASDQVEEVDATVAATTTAEATEAAESEPLAPNQWDMRMIRADVANMVSGGRRDVLVGVLDTGIEATHPDLAPNVDAANSVGCTNEGRPDPSPAAWAPTTSSHGTHVAGTIAAARNGVGVAGVAPNVRIASVKVTDDNGFIYPEYAICGFIWAGEHSMKVTNNSYSIDPWYRNCLNDPDQRAIVESVSRAIDFSARRGVVNVSSLGNQNWDLSHDVIDRLSPDNQTPITRVTGDDCPKLPAEAAGVVGVSSVGPTGQKAYYSDHGISDTEVTAPGGDRFKVPDTPDRNGRVLSTLTGGGWGYLQGTSMAAPHAVGVIALIRSTHPTWSADRVVQELQRQADRIACPANPYDPTGDGVWLATCEGGSTGTGFYGSGLVDALDAVTN